MFRLSRAVPKHLDAPPRLSLRRLSGSWPCSRSSSRTAGRASGLGQLFYVPVVLAALASGPLIGGLAGVAAIVLFEAAMLLNGAVDWHDLDAANTPIRLVSYVLAGVTVGYFATRDGACSPSRCTCSRIC